MKCVRERDHDGPCVENTSKPIFDRMKDGEFPADVFGDSFGVPGVSVPARRPFCRKTAARHFHVPEQLLRCSECGYETPRFRGWAFSDSCRTPGAPGTMHKWEIVT